MPPSRFPFPRRDIFLRDTREDLLCPAGRNVSPSLADCLQKILSGGGEENAMRGLRSVIQKDQEIAPISLMRERKRAHLSFTGKKS